MSVIRDRWKVIAITAGALGAAAGITLGVTTLLGITFDAGGDPDEGGDVPATRDRLAICVEAIDVNAAGEVIAGEADVAVEAREAIENALVWLEGLSGSRSLWNRAGYGDPTTAAIDIGCPAPPVAHLLVEAWFGRAELSEIAGVEEPSRYRLFAFVVPSRDVLGRLGIGSERDLTQEFSCYETFEGTTCEAVTEAIYLTQDELEKTRSLARLIEAGIGLR